MQNIAYYDPDRKSGSGDPGASAAHGWVTTDVGMQDLRHRHAPHYVTLYSVYGMAETVNDSKAYVLDTPISMRQISDNACSSGRAVTRHLHLEHSPGSSIVLSD